MGPARRRGRRMIRSHSCQQRSAIGVRAPKHSAALRHSIAPVNGNPFSSSRSAARHQRTAIAQVNAATVNRGACRAIPRLRPPNLTAVRILTLQNLCNI